MTRRILSVAPALALVALALPSVAGAVLATVTDPPDPTATESCPGTATIVLPIRGGRPVPYPFVPPREN